MTPYNTEMEPLKLHEYGRNIQQMIEYCVSLPDREERTRCAHAIAQIMSNLFPDLLGDKGDDHKIWDHINLMSDFKLDIDFPCDVMTQEEMKPVPSKIPYNQSPIHRRLYGRNMEKIVKVVAAMDESPEKDALISRVAHHMKKLMSVQNKEGVDNSRILRDLADYSEGKILLDPETYVLQDFKEAPKSNQQRFNNNKKKKKKNSN